MANFPKLLKAPTVRRIGLFLVLLVAGLIMLRQFEHNQVYHPSRHFEWGAADLGKTVEDVNFTASDGLRLNGWFFPGSNGTERAETVVLFCHGNGGNISHRMDLYSVFLDLGLAVFTFDYRGYGKSDGKPSETGTYRDCSAAYAWLTNKGYAPANILVLGESLGGGIASELVSRVPAAGLIILSSFTNIPDIGAELFPWLPVRWLARIRYDTMSRLPSLTVPVLIMHSPEDGLINIKHARRNFAAAREPKLFWEIRGGHNEPLADEALFGDGVRKFLKLIARVPAETPR